MSAADFQKQCRSLIQLHACCELIHLFFRNKKAFRNFSFCGIRAGLLQKLRLEGKELSAKVDERVDRFRDSGDV